MKSIRLLGPDDFRECEQVTREVFGYKDVDVIPAWHMYTASLHGALALGAFVDDQLAGYSYAYPALAPGGPCLVSTGLLIRPQFGSLGLGTSLKVAQRQIALERGYELIQWTVDPLAARPLYLYLTKLRATLTAYLPELYEQFALAGVDAGIVADEVQIDWQLDREEVEHAVATTATDRIGKMGFSDISDTVAVTESTDTGHGVRMFDGIRPPGRVIACAVEVPWDLQALKRVSLELAGEWRFGVRSIMERLLEGGYRGTDVVLDRGSAQVFVRFERTPTRLAAPGKRRPQ